MNVYELVEAAVTNVQRVFIGLEEDGRTVCYVLTDEHFTTVHIERAAVTFVQPFEINRLGRDWIEKVVQQFEEVFKERVTKIRISAPEPAVRYEQLNLFNKGCVNKYA